VFRLLALYKHTFLQYVRFLRHKRKVNLVTAGRRRAAAATTRAGATGAAGAAATAGAAAATAATRAGAAVTTGAAATGETENGYQVRRFHFK
jgi:hypothetical protein